ncbi:MAG TPA: glutathione-disulfide reductase [Candidatus Acidoferrum sp.]|nr:glutathione-disulfide reductase [Candidatus Acidoferrum sp.]
MVKQEFFPVLRFMDQFDLFVIGGGSAGVRAARMAAGLGAKVALAESGPLGGTCVNVGCIPKKLYSMAGHFRSDFEDAAGFGWRLGQVTFDWPTLRDNKTAEISRLNGIYQSLLEKAGVTILRGHARLVGPRQVSGNGQFFTARHVLIATGGRPLSPDFDGHELALVSDRIFDLPSLPKRLLILGAGYIGVEFAGIFAGLGVDTTLSWRSELPLKGFDDDVRRHFTSELAKHCRLLPSTRIASLQRASSGLLAHFADGGQWEGDQVLAATGRVANVAGLGLETTGVTLAANGTIAVDAHYRTTEPSIWAIGDVVGHKALTPVALAEAMVVVDQLFGDGKRPALDYALVPTSVFSHPNVATVGLTEAEARSQVGELAIYETDFRHLRHTLSGRNERTYIKVVVDARTDRVLGMHMVGADAGEIIQGFAAALVCGVTKRQLDQAVGIHPTAAEEFVTLRTRSR